LGLQKKVSRSIDKLTFSFSTLPHPCDHLTSQAYFYKRLNPGACAPNSAPIFIDSAACTSSAGTSPHLFQNHFVDPLELIEFARLGGPLIEYGNLLIFHFTSYLFWSDQVGHWNLRLQTHEIPQESATAIESVAW